MKMEAHRLPILAIFLLVLLSTTAPPSSLCGATCNPRDKAVLLKIKAQLGSPSALSSWSPDTDCCVAWHAVTCDSSNRANSIVVQNDPNLKSTIPAMISDLPYLHNITFDNLPGLVGSIPTSITKLRFLSKLQITGTSVTGAIPPGLVNLQNFYWIILSNNKLTGSIPSSFGGFSEEMTILLDHNQLTGPIPQSFDGLVLGSFNVSYNHLCGPIPLGGTLQNFDQYAFSNNKCLCGPPLPACK